MSSTAKFRLSLQEISLATNNFAEENIIGRGGYGLVYRGQSKQHGVLAIKRLNRVYGQGDHEFGMEVQLLSRYKHENLVSLIGFCGEDGEKIVVYKYEANQSLDRFLNSKDLSWTRRLNICLGAARGLRYLHNETGSEHGIIHRDIKSSNILLDENRKAKISDFGLSKIALTSSADSILFTAACGTLGYLDPEYINYGTLTQKSDVYSFGVVLFEVLFGKLVTIVGHGDDGRRFTVVMARRHYEEDTLDVMIDPDLRNEMNLASLRVFSSIAYHCIKNKREDRPTMNSVVEVLEKVFSYQRARTYKILESSSSKFLDDDSDGDDDGSGNYDNPMCQVDDCKKELWGAKDYHRNHKVCEVHCKSVEALVGKQMQRFCQRCGKFHLLFEFEEGKRSCWPRLAGHNKPRSEGVMGNSFLLNANSNENMDVVNLINVLGFRVTTSQEAKA